MQKSYNLNKYIGILALFLAISLVLQSCSKNAKIREINKKYTLCYIAVDGNDTAYLEIDTLVKYEVIGKLNFNYSDTAFYVGDFKGEFKGDTLTGYFDFQLNKSTKWHRNPVAFLKEGDKLVMGDGKFVLIWGSGYFDPQVPIDYSKAKFKFDKISCF